jgi:ribosomal protein S18 acetylase RimI-like enzyme
MIELVEVASPQVAAFSAFTEVARRAHDHDPLWRAASEEAVAWAFAESAAGRTPLRARLALASGSPVARAAALAPPGPVGWIGLFACVDGHRSAALAVLEACREDLCAWGYRTIEAPHSDPLTLGLQTAGFDAPQTLFTPRDRPASLGHFEAAGFHVEQRMVAPLMRVDRVPPLPRPVPGVTVRSLDPARLAEDLASFHDLQADVFGARPGREARGRGDSSRLLERLLPHLDPDLVLIAERAGETVGTLVCLPDGWQADDPAAIDRARILSVAVRADLRRRGVGLAMSLRLARTLARKGYRTCEGAWVREDNPAPLALARRFGARVARRFVLLGRSAR